MKKIAKFLYLHVKNQLFMYAIPILFVYVFLLPYQYQVAKTIKDENMVELFDTAQKFLFLFFGWYHYLAHRMILSSEQREVVRFESFRKESWFCWNQILAFALLSGYFTWLMVVTGKITDCLLLMGQCVLFAAFVVGLMKLTKSALAGFSLSAGYLFLCITRTIPEEKGIIRLGRIPSEWGIRWFLLQMTIILIIFLVCRLRRTIFCCENDSFYIRGYFCENAHPRQNNN